MGVAHACQTCDHLLQLPELAEESVAYCPRCGHHISTRRRQSFQFALSFSVSGLLLLLVSASWPFLSFSISGRSASMTLLDSSIALFNFGEQLLGGVVFTLMFAAPLVLLIVQILLLTLILAERRSPLMIFLARLLNGLRSWNMAEVFLIGVIVSAAKIASMATLELGFAFWAFIGFTLCTIASVALIDRVQLWRAIAGLQAREA